MRKLTLFLVLLCCVSFLVTPALSANKTRAFVALIGGGVGALDKVGQANFEDGDISIVVVTATQKTYIYVYDEDGEQAEDATYFMFIRPDDYDVGVHDLVMMPNYSRVVTADGDTDPTVNDDIDTQTGAVDLDFAGYLPGDEWINDTAATTIIWKCISNADGAAVWKDITEDTSGFVTAVLDCASGDCDDLIDAPGVFDDCDGGCPNANATPDVSGGAVFITANTGATTITDFDTELTNGKMIFVIVNDANTTFDFTASGLEGTSANYTASNGEVLMFIYATADSQWHYNGFPKVFDGVTISGLTASTIATIDGSGNLVSNTALGHLNADGTVKVNTVTDTDGFTMSAAQGEGYVVYATGAGTIVMPPAVADAGFCVENHTDGNVVLNPDATGTEDTTRLNGQALAQGDSITGTDYGDVACCTYYAADTWSCIANGYEDSN